MIRTGYQFTSNISRNIYGPFYFIEGSLPDCRVRTDGTGIRTQSQYCGHFEADTLAMFTKSTVQVFVFCSKEEFNTIVPDFFDTLHDRVNIFLHGGRPG